MPGVEAAEALEGNAQADRAFETLGPRAIWEFPKIGDPNIAPAIVGYCKDPKKKVPLIFGNS